MAMANHSTSLPERKYVSYVGIHYSVGLEDFKSDDKNIIKVYNEK